MVCLWTGEGVSGVFVDWRGCERFVCGLERV